MNNKCTFLGHTHVIDTLHFKVTFLRIQKKILFIGKYMLNAQRLFNFQQLQIT